MRLLLAVILTMGCGSDKDAPELDIDFGGDDLSAITTADRPSPRSEVYGIGDDASNSILVFGGN